MQKQCIIKDSPEFLPCPLKISFILILKNFQTTTFIESRSVIDKHV